MMANQDLFRCLSPLFSFLRVIGVSPFYYDQSASGLIRFRWIHPQTFWFLFFTLAHSFCICYPIFGHFDPLGGDKSKNQTESIVGVVLASARVTDRISHIRFVVDTFLANKIVLFHFAHFHSFFERLQRVDSAMPLPSLVVQRARKHVIIGITILVLWYVAVWIDAVMAIAEQEMPVSLWMWYRFIDSAIHGIGQLHSYALVLQYSFMCYMIGLRYDQLADCVLQTLIRSDHRLDHREKVKYAWTLNRSFQDIGSVGDDETKSPKGNRILSGGQTDGSNGDPSIRSVDQCFSGSLSARLVFLKGIYLTLNDVVVIHLNRIFGFYLLIFLVSKLISSSINCHGFISRLFGDACVSFYWMTSFVPDLVGFYLTFQFADYVRDQVKKFYRAVDEVSTENMNDREHAKFHTFAMQIRGEPVELSVCGLFKLGKQLAPTVAGTIGTYILVLMQFNAGATKDL